MADRRWNEDQEQISDDDVVGKAAGESEEYEEFEDAEEFDEGDQAENEDIDGL
jgi:hypothetical protein